MRASRRLVVAVLLAVGVHAVVMLVAPRAPRVVPVTTRPGQIAVLEPLSDSPVRSPVRSPVTPRSSPVAAPPQVPPTRPEPPKEPAPRPAPLPSPSRAEADPVGAPPVPGVESPAGPAGDLDPRRERSSPLDRAIAGSALGPAASRGALESALDDETPPPLSDAERTRRQANRFATPAPDPRAAPAGPRQVVVVDEDRGLQADLDALGGALDGRRLGTQLEHGRQALVLVRQRDGTLRYETGGFAALILEDGSVRFLDARDARMAPGPFLGNGRNARVNASGDPTLSEVLPFAIEESSIPFASGVFDVNAPLLRAQGNDPFSAEKSCFLDDTRALREELARDARGRASHRGLHELEERLEALLGTASGADVKREIVARWDECARDEESGRRARALIERFVAERMPPGSPFGFTVDELAAINDGRPADDLFQPYG